MLEQNPKVDSYLDQPEPISNDSTPVLDQVIDDMRRRDAVGLARYKTRLQAFNGRDCLKDAYAESLDMAVYLKQELIERDLRMREGMLAHDDQWLTSLAGCFRIRRGFKLFMVLASAVLVGAISLVPRDVGMCLLAVIGVFAGISVARTLPIWEQE